jgi:hypothetical protein
VNLVALSAELREAERDARQKLDQGCAEDLASIERLLDRPLREARTELEAAINGLGPLEPVLKCNIIDQFADDAALRCTRKAFANASVRFRARFALYAEALAEAERGFLDKARAAIGGTMLPRAQRRITLPHIELDDDLAIALKYNVSLENIDRWVDDLERHLRALLEREVNRARWSLISRAHASLARTRVALRLAAQGRKVAL